MEALQRLMAVQSTLHLLQRHSLSSQDALNDRFLAEFLLFLACACKDAEDLAIKCRFLNDQLPKVSNSTALLQNLVFEKTKRGLYDQNAELGKKAQPILVDGICSPIRNLEGPIDQMPSVELRAMERAKSTLEDFCRSYFMFHDMDAQNPDHVFRHLPILAFVESYIYQIDEQKEEQLLPCPSEATLQQDALSVRIGIETFKASTDVPEDSFRPLRAVLAERNLLTKRIEKELEDGREYWGLEQSLCNSLSQKKEILISDVVRAIKLKSFDYRVLNLLLYELSNTPVNEMHIEFLSVSEFLVEVSDDLFDYEEDVLNNTFNILRMFVKIYGSAKAPCMLAQQIAEAEGKYQKLLGKLEPNLAACYQKRCQEAVVEGGSISKHTMGSWIVPPLILDEEAYRAQVNASKCMVREQNKLRINGTKAGT